MSFSVALSTTIFFPSFLSGLEIAKLVEGVVAQNANVELVWMIDRDRPAAILIGQVSNKLCDHLAVCEVGADQIGIQPDTEYDKLSVRHHQWPMAVRIEPNRELKALQCLLDFTRSLISAAETHFGAANSQSMS